MEPNPHFCLAISSHKRGALHISVWQYFGDSQPDSCQVKLSGLKMIQTRKQQLSLGEKGWTTNAYPKANSQVKIQRSNSYKCFLPSNLNFERKGQHEILPTLLNQAQRIKMRADFGKQSHSLLASAGFPRIPSAGSRVSEVSQ